MKPLGYITKYFQFLDPALQMMIEFEMEESYNFSDFSERFCERVINEDSDDAAIFLACQFGDVNEIRALMQRYSENPIIQPFLLMYLFDTGNDVTAGDVIASIQDALLSNPEPWMEIYFQLLLWVVSLQIPKETKITNEALARIEQLFNENENLECFKPEYYHSALQNLQVEPSLKMIQEGIEIAKKYDDLNYLNEMYRYGVWVYRNHDIGKAKECYERAQEISRIMGYPETTWFSLNAKAAIHNICGEFDASVECYQKAIEMIERGHMYRSRRYIPMNLSKIYHEMEQFEDALEWARLSLEDQAFITPTGNPKMSAHLRMALALASLEKVEDAEEHRALGQKLALDSEDEIGLAESQYVLGIIEKAKGNYENAIHCFEDAYRVFERINQRVRMNYTIRHLAECEVGIISSSTPNQDSAFAAKWLGVLEETSRVRHYPGYLGIALVLKSEVMAKKNQFNKAREFLAEAVEISRKPETQYIQKMIAEFLDRTELRAGYDLP